MHNLAGFRAVSEGPLVIPQITGQGLYLLKILFHGCRLLEQPFPTSLDNDDDAQKFVEAPESKCRGATPL